VIDVDTHPTHILTSPEATLMLLVDCPLCDTPAPFDTDLDELDCPACAVRIGLVVDDTRIDLAAAA